MKKMVLFAALVAAVMISSCNSSGGNRELKTEADSLAYVIGLNVGYNLKYNTDSTQVKASVTHLFQAMQVRVYQQGLVTAFRAII